MEQTKVCFRCNKEYPLSQYYVHKQMADGHLNKCKTCTKTDSENRRKFLTETSPEWVEKEAERQRQKEKKRYFTKLKGTDEYNTRIRLGRKNHKEKYPYKIKAANYASKIQIEKGFNRHHWSYLEDNWLNVIILSVEDHYFIHRYLKYAPEHKCYKTPDGTLLDTREKHEQFIMKILELKPKTE